MIIQDVCIIQCGIASAKIVIMFVINVSSIGMSERYLLYCDGLVYAEIS